MPPTRIFPSSSVAPFVGRREGVTRSNPAPFSFTGILGVFGNQSRYIASFGRAPLGGTTEQWAVVSDTVVDEWMTWDLSSKSWDRALSEIGVAQRWGRGSTTSFCFSVLFFFLILFGRRFSSFVGRQVCHSGRCDRFCWPCHQPAPRVYLFARLPSRAAWRNEANVAPTGRALWEPSRDAPHFPSLVLFELVLATRNAIDRGFRDRSRPFRLEETGISRLLESSTKPVAACSFL